MKRLLVLFAIMAFILVPAMAMAYNSGVELLPDAVEVSHWEIVDGAWVEFGTGNVLSNARCWRSGAASDSCNKQVWEIPFTTHASMAQWLFYNLGGTRWDWRIRKPGTYAADCIEATIRSNNDVVITFANFADLLYQETGGVDPTISTWYAWGEDWNHAKDRWVSAADLNKQRVTIGDSDQLHTGFVTKLWNKIDVVNCNSSCEYENTGTIIITLQNMKLWVDPTNGGWLASKNPTEPPPITQ
jgi:hypothetical protein